MKYLRLTGLVLAALLPAFSAPAQIGTLDDFYLSPETSNPDGASNPQALDRIIAVVGDGVILQSELDDAVTRIRANAGARARQMPPDVLRSQVLDRLIMQRLQLQRARERNIQVGEQEIEQGIERIARQNNMDMAQFSRAVAADGMTMDDLRGQVREQIMVSKLRRNEVMSQVTVTGEDVDRYLENASLRAAEDSEYRFRQLIVSLPDDADSAAVAAARDRARELRERLIEDNVDFAELAESDPDVAVDTASWQSGAALDPAIAEAVSQLSVDEVSPVFRDPAGFHVLRLDDVRGSGNTAPERRVMVDEVQARHILLRPNEIRDEARTRALAEQLRERLAAGADFAALAREYSDDSATANQGGDLGWIQPQRLDANSRQQLTALDSGEISPVFRTGSGYEILTVGDRRQRDQTRQAERERARQTLGEQRSRAEGERWLRRIRDEAYVDIRMPGYQSNTGG